MHKAFKLMTVKLFMGLAIFGAAASSAPAALASTPKIDQIPWEKVRDVEGTTVYRREIPGADVLSFRGVGIINASPAKVASIIIDTKRAPEWVEDLASASVIRWLAPDRYVEYDHISTPFVMKDRDFVSLVELKSDRAKHSLILHYQSTEDAQAPQTKFIRGDLQDTTFVLTEIDGGTKTLFDGAILADPKGSVPKWLVNFFQKDWPIDTMRALRKQAAKADVGVDPKIAALLTNLK